MVCAMSAGEVVRLTRMGRFTMDGWQSGAMALLKRLRGSKRQGAESSRRADQMKMLRRIPQLLRFIPGTAQDVRAYFLTLQYWLAGSEDNIVNMVRFLVERYAAGPRAVLCAAAKVGAAGRVSGGRASITRASKGRIGERRADCRASPAAPRHGRAC